MKGLRALIVDDSSLNRTMIGSILKKIDGVESVGLASDGAEALRSIEHTPPDFITLDLHMPNVDGFKFLRLLAAVQPIPVVVVSSHSKQDNIFRALELGAFDFIVKPEPDEKDALLRLQRELAEKVRVVQQLSPLALRRSSPVLQKPNEHSQRLPRDRVQKVNTPPDWLIVVGASTGGPSALMRLTTLLDADMNATIAIAQHMPPKFTSTFARRLDRAGEWTVQEARPFERLQRAHAYVCPGGSRMDVTRSDQGLAARVSSPNRADRYTPSVDALFETAALTAGDRCIAVLLTGMGDDGAAGAARVKAQGGRVLVQSEESAVVFGMPQAAIRAGAVDESLGLDEIASRLRSLTLGE